MRRLDAYRVYLTMGAASSFFRNMIYTVLAVYYVQVVGMNPLQLVLVGTVLELTAFLCEIPTGVVADAYSRRLSVIIGITLVGICFIIEGFVPVFAAILLAEVIRGVGETFISGAESAWIADELGEARLGHAFLRGGQVHQGGAFAGILAGAALGSLWLNLPVYLGGFALIGLALFLIIVMPEQGFTPTPRGERTTWQTMGAITRDGLHVLRGTPVVLMFVLVAVVFGAFSEGFDRLGEAHILLDFTFPAWGDLQPVVWISLINAGGLLVGIFVAEVVIRRLDTTRPTVLSRTLLIVTGLLIAAVIGFGLAGQFWPAVLIYWLAGALRSLQYPLASTWVNQHIHARVRATVLSMLGQADALGQMAGGPVVGFVGLRSLRAAIVFSGLILMPALALYGRGVALADGEAGSEVTEQGVEGGIRE